MNYQVLKKFFWGYYYYDVKNKKISKKGKKYPMFVQYILKVIKDIYDTFKNND